MRLTNNFGLPDPIYQAIANDPYSKGESDYSITGLLKPARISVLEAKHWEEIEEDCSDRIFSLLGQAIHGILERSERVAIAEKRLYMDIGGKRISGQTDRFVVADGLLQDYKISTIFKTMGGKIPEEWVAQQNMYRYLLQANGHQVNRAEVVAIYRDWSKPKAMREEEYPVAQVQIVDIPLWDSTDVAKYILERIRIHEEAKRELPECTAEERWATADSYAVKKPGAKRALRLCQDIKDAEYYVKEHGGPISNLFIEKRAGESKRCAMYCRAANFCDQWKKLQGA